MEIDLKRKMYKTWECGLISYHALSAGQENNLPTHLPSHPLFLQSVTSPALATVILPNYKSPNITLFLCHLDLYIDEVNFFPCHFGLGAFGGFLWSLASSGSYSGGLVCSFD